MIVEKNKTYIGVVVDNNDPKKIGRCRIRVVNIFDDIPETDIPWASPWKDLNGNAFNVPDVGKVLTVIFDSGNIYKPEYICAEHFNINLENKLNSLDDENYKSFRSAIFDHSTQIYRTKGEGLKIDHEYTNINIDQYGNILNNLRDDKSVFIVGSPDADEHMVLGSTFMDWLDTLVENLTGKFGGPFLDASGAPVVPHPGLIECLNNYTNLRNDFLSDHARISKNGAIVAQNREYINQIGDSFDSSGGNSLTTRIPTEYNPSSNYFSDSLDDNPAAFEKYDYSKEGGTDTNTSFAGQYSETQRIAIRASVATTLSRGQGKGRCARYTFNHAKNYLKALRKQKMTPGASEAAGGNAKDNSYHKNLEKQGWKKLVIGRISKATLISELKKNYNIGDIVVYWGMNGSSDNYARYGHTQIFTGGLNVNSNNCWWSTDNNTNYGKSFVYPRKNCDDWYLLVFKAPTA